MGDKVIIQCEQAHLDLVFPTFLKKVFPSFHLKPCLVYPNLFSQVRK